jgi:hypothetical protein
VIASYGAGKQGFPCFPLRQGTGAANRLRLGPGCDREQIEAIVHGCVRHAGLRETYVRVTWLNAAGRRYAGQVTGLTATAP